MADDVQVIIGAKIDGLISAVDQVNGRLASITSTASSVSSGFGRLGEAIIAAFSVEKITEFVNKMADLGLQTERVMATLGLTAEQTLQLGGFAKLTGTSMDGLALSIERTALNVQRSTADAFNPAAQALQVLGLRAKDLIGLPTSEYIDKLHDAVSRFNPSLNLTNAVMAIGGRGVAQMIPLLQVNADQWKRMKEEIDRANGSLASGIPGMAETHQQISLLELSIRSLGAQIFTSMQPAIETIIRQLTSFAQEVRDSIKEDGAWSYVLSGIEYTIKGIATGIASVAAMIRFLSAEAQAFWNTTEKNQSEVGAKLLADLNKISADYKKTLDDLWSHPVGITVNKPVGGEEAGALAAGARNAIEAQKARYEAEIALLQQTLARKKILYDLDAGLWKTTDDQKFASTMAATEAEFQQEAATLKRIRDLWPIHSKEWEVENQKMVAATAKFGTEMVNLNAQSLLSMKAKWDEVLGAMQSSFNGQLRGLLAGTTSFTQAFRTIIGDMVIYFIQAIEKMVFQWIAGQAAQLFATQSTAGAKAASEAAAAEATLPARVASFTSAITADAALVFAGIFANLAPFIGPAAAGPAAAGQATTLAQLVNVPKFDVGTNYVMATGLAMVHQGEQIKPAQGSGPYTESKSGGDTHHWHLIDAAGVEDFVTRNAGAFAAAVTNFQARNRSARPRW